MVANQALPTQKNAPPPLKLDGPYTPHIPYNQNAEEAVLGGVMTNGTLFYEVAQFLKGEDFYILRHRYIWEAMAAITARKEPIDNITLTTELKAKDQLGEIGGPAHLTQLMNNTPTSMHVTVYGRLVQRAAIRRRLMINADRQKQLAMNEEIELSQVISQVEAQQIEIVSDYTGTSTKSMRDATSDYYEHMEHLIHNPDKGKGLLTGFKELDGVLNGLDPDTLTLFAGRPGMGKSSGLTTIAVNMAKAGKRVAYFSMEMLIQRLMRRIISMEAQINSEHLKTGTLNPDEWGRFVKASGEVSTLPIFIDDSAAWTPLQLRAKCTSMKLRHGIDVFIIDHAGLISGGGRYQNNKAAEMAYVSRALKEMNLDLKVPFLVAMQLNRELEKRQDKRPIKSDLRDSGTWEQDADNIIFLYRDEVYNAATDHPNQVDLIVDKQRDGKVGTVSMYFEKTFTKFMDAAPRTIDLGGLE